MVGGRQCGEKKEGNDRVEGKIGKGSLGIYIYIYEAR